MLRPNAPTRSQRRGVGLWLLITGVCLDAAIVSIIPVVAWHDYVFERGGNLKLVMVYCVIAVAMLAPTHRRGRLVTRPSEVSGTVIVRLALAPLVAATLTWWIVSIDKGILTMLVVVTAPAVLLGRLLMFKLVHTVRTHGYDLEDTIVVGAGPIGRDLALGLEENPDIGLMACGFVDRFDEELPYPLMGRPEDLPQVLEESGVRHVVLSFGGAPDPELVRYVRLCDHLPVQFYSVPRFFELGTNIDRRGFEIDGIAVVPLKSPGRRHAMWRFKRLFDMTVSVGLLALTSPLFLLCAIAVRLSSPGPIFFRQQRVGLDGKPFEMIKFRSMRVNDDSSTQWTVDEDDRVTSVGRFLRKSHLDELPQLVNVVRGEMSIVGPRPERPHFVNQFQQDIDGYNDRHRVPVGITGWAQVNGFWGDSSIETRVRLDNRYIENWSPWRDLVIGLRTIPTLLGKRR